MTNYLYALLLAPLLLLGCSPIKTTDNSQYRLESYSPTKIAKHSSRYSILISQPEAVTGYQTEQMLYIKKPYTLEPYANNAWIGPPADMLFPLILQSVQRSGYFYAVASTTNANDADYRLDTQLLALQQNFLVKPSRLQFAAKIVLTRLADNRVIASRIISKEQICGSDTPYGGVIAANKITQAFTAEIAQFLVNSVKR